MGLGNLSPVFPNVLLPQVELQRGMRKEMNWLCSLGDGVSAEKGDGKRYL